MDEFVQSNEKVASFLNEHYLIMKVNSSDENKNRALLDHFPASRGYPHIYVLDSQGTFLHSQGTGELEEGQGYNEGDFMSFLRAWKPAPR